MPAVPVYTDSPIVAAEKASGPTPQTAQPAEPSNQGPYVPATTTTSAAASQPGYAAPQPAARPSQPAPTGVPQPQLQQSIQPTPTQQLPDVGPPAPQPGAVPVPPASHLPPPPKAGEALSHPQTSGATTTMPPQMSYPAPNPQFTVGKSTTTALPPSSLGGPGPTSLQEVGGDSYSHPPGYHQDTYASEFNSAQRAAHNASVRDNSQVFDTGDEDGVWGTAKKWANAAGNSLAAAENEVWKRINKD